MPGVMGLGCLLLAACSEDVELPKIQPDLEHHEGFKISSFSLTGENFNFPENVDSVSIALISSQGTTQCFGAGVVREDGQLRFKMMIPESAEISDGSYIMTMRRADGTSIPGRLSARFASSMLESIAVILPAYMLDGEGTDENPYLIKNDDDFSMFLINLSDDTASYGAGLKFRQTADVTAPDQSALIPGRGYWGAPFAGIYDGEGHTVKNLYYHGGGREDSDSHIGMFTSLLGTATVENLTFSQLSMTGLYKECGALAGFSSGNISISNIKVAGFLKDGYSIGGIVGSVVDGSLTVSGVELCMDLSGSNDIGGVIGRVDKDASVTISGVRTPDTHFSVSGDKSVGGVIGRSIGTASISDVRLEHKVSGEDSDIAIIEAKTQTAGGIIGNIAREAGDHTLEKCYILCPLGGAAADEVGGMVGFTAQNSLLQFKECRMYSVVNGNDNVGGFIGKAELSASSKGVRIVGDDLSSRIAADDADAKVSGSHYVGGFCGYWLAGPLKLESQIKINLPVSGSVSVGGAFGGIQEATISTENFLFGQSTSSVGTTMRVNGSNETGGFAGRILKSVLNGTSRFDYSEHGSAVQVPSPSRFTSVYSGVVAGNQSAGGIVGYAGDSELHYLSCAATVTGSKNLGGIAGYINENDNFTLLEDCTFTGIIDTSPATPVGGIVGNFHTKNRGNLKDCVNYGKITGGEYTGGVIGYLFKDYPEDDNANNEWNIKWCVNVGEVTGGSYVGGIIGGVEVTKFSPGTNYDYTYNTDIKISDCMNSGKIYGMGTGSNRSGGVGGIIGYTNKWTSIKTCANHGEVYSEEAVHGVGGIAGTAGRDSDSTGLTDKYENVDVRECVNTATISSGDKDSFVGGIVGYLEEEGELQSCHNLGEIPCHQNHDSGGIIGCVDHLTKIYRVVNQGKVSYGNATIGTHKDACIFDHSSLYYLEGTGKGWPSGTKVSEANFTKQSSFGGLDFTAVWTMSETGPVLARCPW